MLSSVRQDLVYAIRMIFKTPVVSGIAIVSLAIGVSVNTSVFSLLHAWLLRPLPYPDAERIVMLYENDLTDTDEFDPVAPANYFDWVAQSTSFETFIASRFEPANLTGMEKPEQLTMSVVTPNFFNVLGTDPLVGRTFVPGDGGANEALITVLGETLWRNRFGADPGAVGTTVTLDGDVYTIVGVVPERFDFILGSVNLWVPSDFADVRDDRQNRFLTVAAKLKDGTTAAQAQSELTTIAARLQEQHRETNDHWSITLQTLRAQFPGPTDRGLVNIMMMVVVLVLVVACVNIASLLMAKTEARQKEIALRLALGAGKRRVIRQLLTESVVMALVGGTLGMALSIWGIHVVASAIPDVMPAFFLPTFNGQVAFFGVAVSILAGLTFGIAPATQALGGDLHSSLIEPGRGGTSSKRAKRLRQTFVTVEFAIALAVLVGAAMLTDIFRGRLDVNLGFRPDNILTMALTLPEHRYNEPEPRRSFAQELEHKLESIGGATATALSSVLPRTRSSWWSRFTIDGQPIAQNQEPETTWLSVNADYFATMDIAVREGRRFSTGDRSTTAPVIIVNQRMVDLHFPDGTAIGSRITISGESREIVGVADNIAQRRLTGLEPDVPSVYFPMTQMPVRQLRIILRASTDPSQLAVPVQNAVWSIDPEQPVTAVTTLEDHLKAALAGPTTLAQILFVVGMLALVLSAIGIYGVMAYAVTRRTNEIGIRMALGAKPGQVVSQITRQGATLAALGLAVGIPLAAGVAVAISKILGAGISSDGLGNVELLSVTPLITVGAILASVGLFASYLPARRATRIDPASALTN